MSNPTNASVSAGWLQLVIDTTNELGIDSNALFKNSNSDICSDDIADVKNHIEMKSVLRIWGHAVNQLPHTNLGLALSQQVSIRYFDSVGCSIMSCETVIDACDALITYEDIICKAISHKSEECDDGYKLSFDLADVEFNGASQIIDGMMSCTLELARWMTHRKISPIKAYFKHAPNGPVEEYEKIFSCPVEFGHHENALIFDRSVGEQALPTANPMMSDLYQQINQQALNQLRRDQPSNQLLAKVSEKLITELPNGEPAIKNIASFYNMSLRTFQRRLKDEGWTYVKLLDNTRKLLAKQYLGDDSLSLQEISFLLGFSDYSIFSRAFKRWYGNTPVRFIANNRLANSA